MGKSTSGWVQLGAASLLVSCLLGCATMGGANFDYDRTIARFLIEETEREGQVVTLPISEVRIPVKPTAVVSEFEILDVKVVEAELGQCLMFTLTPAAARAFLRTTALNVGKRLVCSINGAPAGARRIDGVVGDGVIYMFIETPDDELEQIATNLRGTSLDIQKKLNG